MNKHSSLCFKLNLKKKKSTFQNHHLIQNHFIYTSPTNAYNFPMFFTLTERKRDVSFLTNLPGASEKLHFFNADLSNPDSFAAAIEGCVGIFHTASPIDFAVSEPEEIVTKRTVDGALGILKACVNSKTVKRFIYTSSGSAVSFNGKDKDVLDESDWSDVDLLRSVKPFGWNYAVSKTLAEKAVLEFGEQNGIDVVTLILPFIVGRFVCPKLPDSIEKALVLVLGMNFAPYSTHVSFTFLLVRKL